MWICIYIVLVGFLFRIGYFLVIFDRYSNNCSIIVILLFNMLFSNEIYYKNSIF